jgi:hypothetical protein
MGWGPVAYPQLDGSDIRKSLSVVKAALLRVTSEPASRRKSSGQQSRMSHNLASPWTNTFNESSPIGGITKLARESWPIRQTEVSAVIHGSQQDRLARHEIHDHPMSFGLPGITPAHVRSAVTLRAKTLMRPSAPATRCTSDASATGHLAG